MMINTPLLNALREADSAAAMYAATLQAEREILAAMR